MPEEAMKLYGDAFTALVKELGEAAIPPDEVTKFVEHGLTASKPKTRYVVGRDAQIQRLLANVVPDRMLDGLMERQLKLPGKNWAMR